MLPCSLSLSFVDRPFDGDVDDPKAEGADPRTQYFQEGRHVGLSGPEEQDSAGQANQEHRENELGPSHAP
jgi:hypothetical protein